MDKPRRRERESEPEQWERERAVRFTIANMELSGITLSDKDKDDMWRYVRGEVTLDELLASAHEFARAAQATDVAMLGILQSDDGEAARSHLAAGRPIHYCEDEYPGEIVREWPDGRRELVKVGDDGSVVQARPHPAG